MKSKCSDDDRPARAIVVGQRLFHDRPHAFEEIGPQLGLRARHFLGVRDHDAALAGRRVDIPGQVLLDPDRESGAQRAVDAVRPFAFVRVAVVSVQHRAIMVQVIERPLRKRGKRQQRQRREIS